MPESNIAKVRNHLARLLEQGASEGEKGEMAQDGANVYHSRFPEAARLGK
ncbi:hypothetical protein [Acidocella aminolytica]|nr:hypothetical protein [Acidocella aminolytica]